MLFGKLSIFKVKLGTKRPEGLQIVLCSNGLDHGVDDNVPEVDYCPVWRLFSAAQPFYITTGAILTVVY